MRRLVGFAIAIGIVEVDQFGAVGDVGTTIARLTPVGISRPSAKMVVRLPCRRHRYLRARGLCRWPPRPA